MHPAVDCDMHCAICNACRGPLGSHFPTRVEEPPRHAANYDPLSDWLDEPFEEEME